MKRDKSGFTLIELLVVIAIIAILAAILFPVFASTKEKGRQTQCLNNLMQLGKGFQQYVDDWSRYPGGAPLHENPRLGQWVVNASNEVSKNYVNVSAGGLFPYVRNTKVYVCPSDKAEYRKINGKMMHFGMSYSINWYFPRVRESAVRLPTKTVLLIDEGASSKMKDGKLVGICDGYFGPGVDRPGDAHVGGSNFGFPDGHAKWVQTKDLSKLNWGLSRPEYYDF